MTEALTERTTSLETLREAGAQITEIAIRLSVDPTINLSTELWHSVTQTSISR